MKNIVLCSDGTGNKGGYGADSNVYKTYKAVDIKNPGVDQYTFYDQGSVPIKAIPVKTNTGLHCLAHLVSDFVTMYFISIISSKEL